MMAWFSPEWQALFVAVFGAAVAIQALREATRNSPLEKIADVLMECTGRYGALIEMRHALKKDVHCGDTTAQSAANRYYHAYWNLQWGQWTGPPPHLARAEIDHLISDAFKKGRRLRIGFVRKSLSRSS